MKIASARGLKEELLDLVKDPSPLPKGVTQAFAESASPRALQTKLQGSHVGTPSRIAVGVTQGTGSKDYRVGVRIEGAGARAQAIKSQFESRSKGEADVRIVPHIRARPQARKETRRAARLAAGLRYQKRQRPLEAGYSVGHVDITAGTLGFFVEDQDAYYILSNNHVLANVNQGQPGDLVVQAGPLDGGKSKKDIVAVLDRFVPISITRSNLVDCAIAAILPDQTFYPWWSDAVNGQVRKVRQITEEDLGQPVSKVGRTTGVTHGTISVIEIDRLPVDMGEPGAPKVASFSDQFEIIGDNGVPFSLGGDSGSLIIDANSIAVGLLFAGGADDNGVDLTFANHIETVLSKLGVTLVK
jgi:hypothetical protein